MFSFEIKYAKAADKFLRQHEDIRKIYEHAGSRGDIYKKIGGLK